MTIQPQSAVAVQPETKARHWLVRFGLVTLMFLLLFGGQLALAERIAAFWVGLVQPLVPASAQTAVLAGRQLRLPTGPLNMFMSLAAMTHLLLAPLLACLYVYHKLTRYTPRPDGHTYCGQCGYILKGLAEPRCPECGRQI